MANRHLHRLQRQGHDQDVFGGKACSGDVNILDVAARSATQSDGTAQISLNAFSCLDPRPMPGGGSLTYAYPVTVLATPQAAGPVHLAVEAQIVVDAGRPGRDHHCARMGYQRRAGGRRVQLAVHVTIPPGL